MPTGTGLALRITTTAIMDRASQVLAEVFSAGESAPYRAVEKSRIAAKHISETFWTPHL
jgi:hypothetical protein